eukprot:255632_1
MNRDNQGIGIYNATQNHTVRQLNQFAAQNPQTNTPQVAQQVPPQYTYFIDSDNQTTPRLPPYNYHAQMSRPQVHVSAMAMQPNANQHQGQQATQSIGGQVTLRDRGLQDLAIVLSRLVQNQNRILQWINQQNSQQ